MSIRSAIAELELVDSGLEAGGRSVTGYMRTLILLPGKGLPGAPKNYYIDNVDWMGAGDAII